MDDDKNNYGRNSAPVQKFRAEFIALAEQSVKEEAKKYAEALDALMKERAKIYLLHREIQENVDMSPENNKDIQHIVKMTEYKEILKEEQHEFHFFYQKQVEQHAPRFVQNMINVYFKDNLNSLTKMS